MFEEKIIEEKINGILDKAEKNGVSLTQFEKEDIVYAEFKEPCLVLIIEVKKMERI